MRRFCERIRFSRNLNHKRMNPVVIIIAGFLSVVNGECDNRPESLKQAENECQQLPDFQVGLLDKIEQNAKSFLNKAKEHLGMETDEIPPQERKCGYYKCVFEKLDTVNTFELPDLGMIGTWIAGNVDENYQQQLNTDVQRCFKVLSTSLVNIQNNCDTAAHLMNCLSTDDECSTFAYP